MKTISTKPIQLLALLCLVAHGQQTVPKSNSGRYPNELPTLKIYETAKWKTIVPHVSTRADVETLLGQPTPVRDPRFYNAKLKDYFVGYEYDSDWIVQILYIGEYGSLRHLAGRVSDIRIYPKRRVSMVGVQFPGAFTRSSTVDRVRNEEFTNYSDNTGLYYSIYARDSPDGQHLAGDLNLIKYDLADDDLEKESHP